MFKRLWIAALLAAAALHAGAIAKTKEKDKGTVDVVVTAPAIPPPPPSS